MLNVFISIIIISLAAAAFVIIFDHKHRDDEEYIEISYYYNDILNKCHELKLKEEVYTAHEAIKRRYGKFKYSKWYSRRINERTEMENSIVCNNIKAINFGQGT